MVTRFEECPLCGEPVSRRDGACEHCGVVLEPPAAEHVLDREMEFSGLVAEVDDFTIAYLRGAELRGAQLSGIDLFGANLVGADLRGADLGAGNLSSADLRGADLSGSNLVDADLSDADLGGADLSGANLLGADLRGAHYDGSTAWPQGCRPEARGAISRIAS
jgi:uncharacterized protein YjbI with pentapeptide repeats